MHIERFMVPAGRSFRLDRVDPDGHAGVESKSAAESLLAKVTLRLRELQQILYAENRWGVLLILQAMDTAGKDGAIKHVMSGVNPFTRTCSWPRSSRRG